MYENYERLLLTRGVTTADVCRATGLKESSISNWKRRGGNCNAKTAKLLCDYFDVSMDYLTNGAKADKEQMDRIEAIFDDRDLMDALRVYRKLSSDNKKLVINLIHSLGSKKQ